MKKFVLWGLLILAYLLFGSDSCERSGEEEQRREEERMQASVDSMVRIFGEEKLSAKYLEAFEVKAVEKLEDLSDYLQIYLNGSPEDPFRQQTGDMIRALFISDTVLLRISLCSAEKEGTCSLKEILSRNEVHANGNAELRFDSIQLIEPLHGTDSCGYRGVVGFVERYGCRGDGRSQVIKRDSRRVEIVALRSKQRFGADSIPVWKVYLGGIR